MNTNIPGVIFSPASQAAPLGMLASVTFRRKGGMRTAPDGAVLGLVRMDMLCGHSGRGSGFTSELVLHAPDNRSQLHIPLFDPVMVKWDEAGIFVRGIEIHIVDGVPAQVVQTWVIKPAPASA